MRHQSLNIGKKLKATNNQFFADV